jgi:hypothetical protein
MSGIPNPPDFGSIIQQLASEFTSVATALLVAIDSAAIDLARVAYVTVILLGTLLYFTHLERRLGKDLVKGGVVLAVLSEIVFPQLFKL